MTRIAITLVAPSQATQTLIRLSDELGCQLKRTRAIVSVVANNYSYGSDGYHLIDEGTVENLLWQAEENLDNLKTQVENMHRIV